MKPDEAQIEGFFARYDPAVARLGRALRAKLRARLPGLLEIVYVYERQESLVISYSPTEHGYDGVCSLAVRPDEANLHFARGAELAKSDPKGLLRGRGKTVRHVALESPKDLDRPEIEALMVAALELGEVRLDASAPSSVIIKAESQKQRALRAQKAPRPAPPAARPKRQAD